MDIDLSDQGIGEAHQAGKPLKSENYSFDSLFRSFELYVSLNKTKKRR
jgi:bisphosphoglycerate-dependent phosphoglycerate mutase